MPPLLYSAIPIYSIIVYKGGGLKVNKEFLSVASRTETESLGLKSPYVDYTNASDKGQELNVKLVPKFLL